MMFDKEGKDNTMSNNAKSLCESCRFRNPNTVNDYCRLDREFRKSVGICKDYQEYKNENSN